MAVRSVKERWRDATAEVDRNGVRASRSFDVQCDRPTDGPMAAVTAAGLPRQMDPHPADGRAKCRRIHVSAVNGPCSFVVTAQYDSGGGGGTIQFGGEDPLDAPPTATWSWQTSSEPIESDALGRPIVNSVGVPFDPPLVEEVNDPVLTISRYIAEWDERIAIRYKNAVNSDQFGWAEPGQAKMIGFEGELVNVAGKNVWRRTCQIAFRDSHPNSTPEKAWHRRVLNQGFMYWTGQRNTAGKKIFADVRNEGRTEPVLLDAEGRQLANEITINDDGMIVLPDAAYWIEIPVKKRLPFGELNLL